MEGSCMKFEYHIYTGPALLSRSREITREQQIVNDLNELGDDGWELICPQGNGNFLLKRVIK